MPLLKGVGKDEKEEGSGWFPELQWQVWPEKGQGGGTEPSAGTFCPVSPFSCKGDMYGSCWDYGKRAQRSRVKIDLVPRAGGLSAAHPAEFCSLTP